MENLVYGTATVEFDSLPAVSQRALAQRGLAHFLGNEQASKVAGHFEGKEPTDDEKAAYKAECVAKALQALIDGTVGTRIGTPRGTQIETIMRRIAEAQVRAVLKGNGITMPSGDKVVKLGDQEFTRAQLITRRLENPKFSESIRKEAEAEMKRVEKAAGAGEGTLDL